MKSLYASIIIPTHDRHTTLPYSVRSALAQTIREIEVILLGDGCTPEVREVARVLAREDPRVRFLDRQKAPFRGGANRDIAVRSSLASRIFYNDDDDLLLPHHVEVLGAELDRYDVVDTPVVSVGTEGRIALGLIDSGHPLQRKLLLEERYKGVFDTHLAHRKEAYDRLSGGWMHESDHRTVLHMLKSFAACPTIRWQTINRVTALSFHGARRVLMGPDAREAELQKWIARLKEQPGESLAREIGGYAAHFFRLVAALQGDLAPGCSDLFSALGIGEMAPAEGAALQAVIDMYAGVQPDRAVAAKVLDELLDPVLGPEFPGEFVLRLFRSVFLPEEILEMLGAAELRPAVALARFRVMIDQELPGGKLSETITDCFDAVPLESRFFFGVDVLACLSQHGHFEEAWRWSHQLLDLAPHSRHALRFWKLRKSLAVHVRDVAESFQAEKHIHNFSTLVT